MEATEPTQSTEPSQSSEPAERRRCVEAIHATEMRLVLAVAGGGNAVITDLLDVPGASNTVLEVRVPYAEAALADLVIDEPNVDAGAVSQPMAEAMAAACLARAGALVGDDQAVLGVACTAALVSDRPKRGDHRAHIVVADESGLKHWLVSLEKGRHDRAGEDRIVADAVLGMIAEASGLGRWRPLG